MRYSSSSIGYGHPSTGAWAALVALPLMLAFGTDSAQASTRIQFVERAVEWGLDFHHNFGRSGRSYMVETMVGGLAVFDYDGDGDQDVLFVDGGVLPGYEGPPPKTRLFRNEGRSREGALHFVDVTDRSAIDFAGYGCGAVSGDVDGDGDIDLYLTAFGANALYINQGDGTFERADDNHGVDDSTWSAAASFSDIDLDGDLDLYVANYTDFALDNHLFCGDRDTGERGYCHPDVYNGRQDRLFRNRGDGVFDDVTESAGLAGREEAGLGVVFSDFDLDGWPDLYVANDKDPNFLFRNKGDGTFEDLSLLSGAALDSNGAAEAGMGVEAADFDGDGLFDIVVTNFALETNGLYKNVGSGVFLDHRFVAGIAEPSLHRLAFGVSALDADQDGDLDLFVANGHILPNAATLSQVKEYEQPNQLFENTGRGRFIERGDVGLDQVRVSRGSATGDLDLDGDLEILVTNSNQVAEVYENRSTGGGFLQVSLRAARSNRFGVGARIRVETVGESTQQNPQIREVRTSSSYLSQSSLDAHFGIGESPQADVTVAWPGRESQRWRSVPTGVRVRLSDRIPGPGDG